MNKKLRKKIKRVENEIKFLTNDLRRMYSLKRENKEHRKHYREIYKLAGIYNDNNYCQMRKDMFIYENSNKENIKKLETTLRYKKYKLKEYQRRIN
ncbi:MAG: hypothetical protein RSE41_03655 [Clostridia bacterium]